jgi:DNA polymerase-3 subunit delta'
VGKHPDLHEYAPEGKSGQHSMETLRAMIADVYLAPYTSDRKVFILYAAERMLLYSANALLKTFEEPSSDSVVILISSQPAWLLPTILSRCCMVRFGALAAAEMALWLQNRFQIDAEKASSLAIAARGSLAQACHFATSGEKPVVVQLLAILAQGRFASYADLTATARTLAEQIEASSTSGSEQITLSPEQGQVLTAVQRQRLVKDTAGTVALLGATEAHLVLETLAAWYRDMMLLHCQGAENSLWHYLQRDEVIQALQRGRLMDLDHVLAAIEEAHLALQRSNPLAHVLETLFLRLDLL